MKSLIMWENLCVRGQRGPQDRAKTSSPFEGNAGEAIYIYIYIYIYIHVYEFLSNRGRGHHFLCESMEKGP